MKNLILKTFTIFISFFVLNSNLLLSYGNVYAHPEINKAIVEKFIKSYLNYPEFKNYTIALSSVDLEGIDVMDTGYEFVNSSVVAHTPNVWIERGGFTADEPELPAALRHFYDPAGKFEGKKYLTDLNIKFVNPHMDAITWHFSAPDNAWTWDAGKSAMRNALAEANPKDRNTYLALAFRCLGEVLHNTADMFCPPHVRNDAHAGFKGFGGVDPYESLFNPVWVNDFKGDSPDPQLADFLKTANKAIEINKYAAEYTNKYFFSDEMISGPGVEQYSSRNGFPDYDSPKLDPSKYTEEYFTYTYTFPSGRKVKMCTDKSLFFGYISANFRSYPRVNEENVKSQASELVPNIIASGARVIKNFIPVFEITAEANLKDKKLFGEVKHITTEEYLTQIGYNGEVAFFINNKMSKINATAVDGKFEVITDEFKAGDKIQAYIYFADITVKSDEIKVEDNTQYEIQNFEFPQGNLTTEPESLLGYHNNRYWFGESTTQIFTFRGSINAPAGTEIRPIEYYNNGEMDVSIFCMNDKEIDVNLKITFNSSPEEWSWYGRTGMDTTTVPFKFDGFDYKLEDNGYDANKLNDLLKNSVVNYDKENGEFTVTFKFNPKIHFEGEAITNSLHIHINPKIICMNNKEYNYTSEDGYIIATKPGSYYFGINFWQHYKE